MYKLKTNNFILQITTNNGYLNFLIYKRYPIKLLFWQKTTRIPASFVDKRFSLVWEDGWHMLLSRMHV